MSPQIVGLDIGGANLKAATPEGEAASVEFPLWKHPTELVSRLRQLVQTLPKADRIAVTMSGEMCDCFETREEGVEFIVASVAEAFPATERWFWLNARGFVPSDSASQNLESIASANWSAQAEWATRFVEGRDAFLIDCGSTTTDIVPWRSGAPCWAGRNDYERLRNSELVYTGCRRTPVAMIDSECQCAELFATMQDVWMILGEIPEEPDNYNTADNRAATIANSRKRLARMNGIDYHRMDPVAFQNEVEQKARMQESIIANALKHVMDRTGMVPEVIMLSGSGEFLARRAIVRYTTTVDFQPLEEARLISLNEMLGPKVSECACAYAVAVLAEEAGQ